MRKNKSEGKKDQNKKLTDADVFKEIRVGLCEHGWNMPYIKKVGDGWFFYITPVKDKEKSASEVFEDIEDLEWIERAISSRSAGLECTCKACATRRGEEPITP